MNANSNPEDRELIPGDRRKNDPAPTAKMSPLWQVRASPGDDIDPSDRSALANSDVPARVHPVRSKGGHPAPRHATREPRGCIVCSAHAGDRGNRPAGPGTLHQSPLARTRRNAFHDSPPPFSEFRLPRSSRRRRAGRGR